MNDKRMPAGGHRQADGMRSEKNASDKSVRKRARRLKAHHHAHGPGQGNSRSATRPSGHDPEQIVAALDAILAPDQVTELRAVGVVEPHYKRPHTVSGYFDSADDLASAADAIEQASGIYIVLNPVNPDLLARAANRARAINREPLTTDDDIDRRRWLLIDLDPQRPVGISASDAEHDAAIRLAHRVRDALVEDGWPLPIVADSGNGTHLLYRIDLQTDDDGLVKRVLEVLAFRFDTEQVQVDQSTHNPARLWKLYGTVARKGDNTEERPHRLAQVLEVPDHLSVVPAERLQSLTESLPTTKDDSGAGAAAPRSNSSASEGFDLERWIDKHDLDLSGPTPWRDGQRWIFETCPWNAEHTNRSAYLLQFGNGAVAAGCLHNGCREHDWHVLRDAVEPGWRESCPTASTEGRTGVAVDAAWDTPASLRRTSLPPFPTDALPAWLREYVDAVAVATQTPPDMAAMLTLSVLATACAKRVDVVARHGWVEPVNLYAVVALPPGNRKSAVFAEVVRPLEDEEAMLVSETKREIAEARTQREILEERLKKTRADAARAEDQAQADLTRQARQLAGELAETVVPATPRLLADDASPEKLATIMTEQDGRIAIMSPEGDVFDLMAGRYSASGSPNLGVYLKAHAADDIRVDRVHRASEFIRRPALTIGLAVQPEVLRGLVSKPGFRGRGLLGRFLYSIPESPLGRRDIDPPAVPEHVRNAYQRNVRQLVRIRPLFTPEGEQEPYQLRLSPGAAAELQLLQRWLEPRLGQTGQFGTMADWAGKLAGAMLRIAGLLHMAHHVDHSRPWEREIEQATMQQAATIARAYLIPHAEAAFDAMGAEADTEDARYLLDWIERLGVEAFTKRDLFEKTKGYFKQVKRMEPGLKVLEAHSYIRKRAREERSGPGRKPSRIYDVNPHLVSHNSQDSHNTSRLSDLTQCAIDSANSANSATDDPLEEWDDWDLTG